MCRSRRRSRTHNARASRSERLSAPAHNVPVGAPDNNGRVACSGVAGTAGWRCGQSGAAGAVSQPVVIVSMTACQA